MDLQLIYRHIFSNYLYPGYNKIIGRDNYGAFRQQREIQFWVREKIDALRLAKLKSVLTNARDHVPYYREQFKSLGFIPDDLTSLAEFSSIDFFITKSDVRDNTEAFLAENRDDRLLKWHRTGGSTGTPLYFPTDRNTDAASAGSLMKALDWWGTELGEPHSMFWGSPTFINRGRADILKQFGNRVRNKLMNRQFFLNYNINEQNAEKIYRRLERFKPSYVRGMPTSLAVFAKIMQKKEMRLEVGRPKFVLSGCEQLFDWQKDIIEEIFGAPVLNTYGVSEVGEIAFEANCRNLHLMDDDMLVELFSFFGNEKEIVTTQLNNLISPLIRYRTGDIADAVEKCSDINCRLNLETLVGLKGRAHDFVIAPDGRFLHGQFLTHIIVFERGVNKFQVVQTHKNRFEIKLVIGEDYETESEDRIIQAIRSYMGKNFQVEFSYLDDIPLSARGKHRWIVSKLGTLDQHI